MGANFGITRFNTPKSKPLNNRAGPKPRNTKLPKPPIGKSAASPKK